MPDKPIKRFTDEYAFLSNFYPAPTYYKEHMFPTSEHAYQAAKMKNRSHFYLIAYATTPGKAKRLGNEFPMRTGWENKKLKIMKDILTVKFEIPRLKELLIATGNVHLEEGNGWGDTFWGVSDGFGDNHLGKILMEVREAIYSKELEHDDELVA